MILSHQHRFIFLKTSKTAGTSVEIALSKHCGPEDVITAITPPDEKRRAALGYRGAQNHLYANSPLRLSSLVRKLRGPRHQRRFYNHMTAEEVRARVGEGVWSGYYKFCIVRNPWDRVISDYFWTYRSSSRPAVAEYLKSNRAALLKRHGYDVYTIDGEIVADRVCRFENMVEELEDVRRRLGIPEELVLPRAKSGYRVDKRSYREILSPEERDAIARLFREEIELFGYRF